LGSIVRQWRREFMTLLARIYKWKTELASGGCQPTHVRMAPDVYGTLCEELDVPEGSPLAEIHGLTVKVSKNLRHGMVVIEEDAKAMHKRMKEQAQKGREG
jgi:hypothetical protein